MFDSDFLSVKRGQTLNLMNRHGARKEAESSSSWSAGNIRRLCTILEVAWTNETSSLSACTM